MIVRNWHWPEFIYGFKGWRSGLKSFSGYGLINVNCTIQKYASGTITARAELTNSWRTVFTGSIVKNISITTFLTTTGSILQVHPCWYTWIYVNQLLWFIFWYIECVMIHGDFVIIRSFLSSGLCRIAYVYYIAVTTKCHSNVKWSADKICDCRRP